MRNSLARVLGGTLIGLSAMWIGFQVAEDLGEPILIWIFLLIAMAGGFFALFGAIEVALGNSRD